MRMCFFYFTCAFVSVLTVIGCKEMQAYSVGIKNTSRSAITDAHVRYAGIRSAGGNLQSGASKSHGDLRLPIPEKAVVEWRTKDNVLHSEEVLVRSAIPKDMKVWLIEFEIDDSNKVTIRPQSNPRPGLSPYDLPDLPAKRSVSP